MSNLLVHIADRVLNRPLMVTPEKLAMIAQVLDGRIGIDASEFAAIEAEQLRNGPDASRFVGQFDLANQNDPKSTKPYRTTDKGVALINVFGSLVNRGAWIGARSGMTSYEGLKYQIAAAAADRDVTSILLDIDSPGGEAVGAFEVADAVRAASKSKDIVAVVNGMAASAAYAIASGAPTIITTASGISGSIGVVMMHADYSHALHEKGITPTLIHAGARKVDGSPYKQLTDDVKAELKAEVDSFYDLFVVSVAVGRKGNMTDASIRATEARTYIGADAVKVGLADALGTFETVLADLSRKAPKVSAPRQSTIKNGLHVGAPSKAVGPRSAEDCAQIAKVAAHNPRLAAQAKRLCDTPYENCSQVDALRVMEITRQSWARHDAETSLHESGLFLDPKLNVRGGPLFVAPGADQSAAPASDYAWGEVVADINRKNKFN
jgi:signal peptide peptidase SppA